MTKALLIFVYMYMNNICADPENFYGGWGGGPTVISVCRGGGSEAFFGKLMV